uniref:Uncharacterized protein n=1 Tax=Siphoviridae sp. cttG32 TaxID=2825705 RepID=A0A8S5U4X3_9CAUD|nr:MAG TPA: hypothetical protein [Siphoviridae sp. cttG32]
MTSGASPVTVFIIVVFPWHGIESVIERCTASSTAAIEGIIVFLIIVRVIITIS